MRLGLFLLLLPGQSLCGMMPEVPGIGDKMTSMEYIPWAIIAYTFCHLMYLQSKYLYPLLEEMRQLVRNREEKDPQNLDPEDRGPVLKESFWIWLTQAMCSIFHIIIVIGCNAFQETPLGVSTLVGTTLLDNFMLLGIVMVVAKRAIFLNSWITLRDAAIVLVSIIIFIAFVFFEDSTVIGIFYWICLLVYWLLEAFSKKINQKLKALLFSNTNSQFPHIQELLSVRRKRISWQKLKDHIPKMPDHDVNVPTEEELRRQKEEIKRRRQEEARRAKTGEGGSELEPLKPKISNEREKAMLKWAAQFNSLYMSSKSTAKKMRIIVVKKKLFMNIARVCVGITQLKLASKNRQKKDRNSLYITDTKDPKVIHKNDLKAKEDDIYEYVDPYELKPKQEENEKEVSSVMALVEAEVQSRTSNTNKIVDNDEEKKELIIEVYKGKYYLLNQKITNIFFFVLMPLTALYRFTLPVMGLKRSGKRHIVWGLIVCTIYIVIFSIIIVWVEDALFSKRGYPQTLFGFVINAPLLAMPMLMQNLSILDPALPMFNFFAYFQQMTIFRICCVLGIAWIFELAISQGKGVFAGNVKSINTGLLAMVSYEIVLIVIIFLTRWKLEGKIAWVLIISGILVYLGVIGIGFL